MSIRIVPDRPELSRVASWIFVLAWIIGNVALIAGFEAAQGWRQEAIALCIFAVPCTMWWGAYKVSDYRNRGGFIVITLWLCSLIVPLLNYRHYITDLFFWGSAVMLVLLAAASVLPWLRERQREPSGATSSAQQRHSE